MISVLSLLLTTWWTIIIDCLKYVHLRITEFFYKVSIYFNLMSRLRPNMCVYKNSCEFAKILTGTDVNSNKDFVSCRIVVFSSFSY